MHPTTFSRWISAAAAGTLTTSLVLLTGGCDRSRQTKTENESAGPAREAIAERSGHGHEATSGVATTDQRPSTAAGGQGETPLAGSLQSQTAAASSKPANARNAAAAPATMASTREKPARNLPSTRQDLGDEVKPGETAPAAVPAVGVRLAPDVRLPVAAIPIDFTISPVAEEARQQIIKDYYREVAAAVKKPAVATADGAARPVTSQPDSVVTHSGISTSQATAQEAGAAQVVGNPEEVADNTPDLPEGVVIEDGDDGPTVVVTNRPEVEAARQRADWRYKALFGDAAYNRMVMQSLIESRLPEHAASNSDSKNRSPLTDGD